MKKVWQILSYILVAAIAASAALFTVGWYEEVPTQSKLDQLADLIEERFIGESDRKVYEDAAAVAMVDALGDEWSYYIPADQMQAHTETVNNAYVGIGITIMRQEDGSGFQITKVNEGGSADRAGIKPGDVIVGIEGQSAAGMTAEDARNLVRGEENTIVNLTVRRGEEELEFSVTRMQVLTPVAVGQMLDGQVGLITITNFDARCFDESKAAIESLLEQGAESLIFDVRNNPGGYKHELVALLDYLLPEGPLFRSEMYDGKSAVDESDASCLEIPMAVLVNGDSYSAAEFFAAALRVYDAALVVGEQTSGKGYFQVTYMLPDGSGVALSIGKYYTPKGNCLEGVGITPDFVVGVDDATAAEIYNGTLNPMEDPQILKAIEALQSK